MGSVVIEAEVKLLIEWGVLIYLAAGIFLSTVILKEYPISKDFLWFSVKKGMITLLWLPLLVSLTLLWVIGFGSFLFTMGFHVDSDPTNYPEKHT